MRKQREDCAAFLPRVAEALRALGMEGRVPGGRVTQVQAREILLAALAGMPPGLPLPSIRQVAQLIGTTQVTLHRTIERLAQEGVLEARSRSGVFTAAGVSSVIAPTFSGADAAAGTGTKTPGYLSQHVVSTVITFSSDSRMPYQFPHWQRLRDEFRLRNHVGDLQLKLEPDSPQRDAACDCFERHAWSDRWSADSAYLELEGFLGGEFAALAPRLSCRRSLLLGYRTAYLFINRDLLKTIDLPAPDYRTFADQLVYLRTLTERSVNTFGESPVSAVYPVALLGAYADIYLDALQRGSELSPGSREALGGIVALARLFQYRHSRSDHLELFYGKQITAFAGTSDHYWRMSGTPPEFPYLVYPLLAAGDSLVLQPLLGSIGAHTRYPLECLRLLALLAEEDEAGLPSSGAKNATSARTGGAESRGGIPGNRRVRAIRGCPLDGTVLTELARASVPFSPPDNTSIYLMFNILNGEIWPVLEGRRDFMGILPNARAFAAAYLNTQPGRVRR